MYMTVFLHSCMCTTHIPGTLRGQKRSLGPLDLELWMVVNHLCVMEMGPRYSQVLLMFEHLSSSIL